MNSAPDRSTTCTRWRIPSASRKTGRTASHDIWSDSGTRRKLGDLVPAFMNAYYDSTGVPVVGVTRFRGGHHHRPVDAGNGSLYRSGEPLPGGKGLLNENEAYTLRHVYLVWCQGRKRRRRQYFEGRLLQRHAGTDGPPCAGQRGGAVPGHPHQQFRRRPEIR